MKILANDGISQIGQQILQEAGYEVCTEKVAPEQLIQEINTKNYQIVLVRSATFIRKDIIDACPNLKLIGRGGVGMDNIDVDYARSRGIIVVNTPDASSQSVAELVIGSMFAISRFFHDSYKNLQNGDFSQLKKQYAKGVELRGKTLGIIGFGRIGQSVASYALSLGMNVLAVDHKSFSTDIIVKIGANTELAIPISTTTNMDDILGSCDYISVHVPKQDNGQLLLGKNEFAKMKRGVRLINASRGGVVDENTLIDALDCGQIAACAIDVFENEPTPMHALLDHPKIACTPHIGASTSEAQARIGEELAQLIISKVPILNPELV